MPVKAVIEGLIMMKKKIYIIFIALFALCLFAGVFAEEAGTFGQVFPEEILADASESPVLPDIMTVTAANNKNVTGTYRKYDSGKTPVIVVLEGSSVLSQNSPFLAFDDLRKYNMYSFNSTSPNGKSFSLSTSYKSREAIETGYCQVVAEEVKKVFPDAAKIGIISYSAGGYGANGVAKSISESGSIVSWVAGYDNILREDQHYKTFDDYIKKSTIPSLLGISSDKYRLITQNSITEAKTHPDDYTVICYYSGYHGKFVRSNSANILTGNSLSSDLASFAEQYFCMINDSE
jgi:hypothetical protein